jgi:hypothetical protein
MSQPNPIATIMGGETVEATLINGSRLAVFARQMPVRTLLTGFFMRLENEAEMLDQCCRAPVGCHPLPEGWVDALTDASHLALVEKLKQLNFQRAVGQIERLTALRAQLQPVETRMRSLPTSSPTPP